MTTLIINDTNLVSAVQDFFWYQLQESTQGILSGLKACYARLIMAEEQKPLPDKIKIQDWDEQRAELSRIERESINYSSREQMTNIIIRYSPLLKATA